MSDTPTYDQLSALCAQMAASLQAITEMSGPMALRSAKAAAEIDLTAYRTLSPDPQWQRVDADTDWHVVSEAIDEAYMNGEGRVYENGLKAAFKRHGLIVGHVDDTSARGEG